jgi:hypothetical protein
MRSTLSLLGTLVFLEACSTASKTVDVGPPARSAAAPSAAAAAAAPAPATSDVTLERSYRSPVPLCLDAALRLCREREFQVRAQDRSGEESASLRAQGRSLNFTLAFARSPAQRTRVVMQLQGPALQENREEASRLLDRLAETLLEPRE